jgi:hypothetical protein
MHVGIWQRRGLPLHTPERQSVPPSQSLPSAHGPQLPPQSTSVSGGSTIRLVQVAPTQMPLQKPVVQSRGAAHFLPSAHFGHTAPPQSTSVSVPFVTTSVHAGTLQVPFSQTPLAH